MSNKKKKQKNKSKQGQPGAKPAPRTAPVARPGAAGAKIAPGKPPYAAVDAPLSGSAALAITFLAGVATMAIEMTASRLLAPAFGTSFAVWTNIIGVMMAALSVGYTIGGRLADKHPTAGVLSGVILVSGLWAALVPLIATALLRTGVELGLDEFPGSLLGTAVLFAPPIFLLGMVNPFAIRLATTDVATVGGLSGRVYAVSTLGSLLGTLLPVLITIPVLGTARTMYLFAGLLIVTGLWCGSLSGEASSPATDSAA